MGSPPVLVFNPWHEHYERAARSLLPEVTFWGAKELDPIPPEAREAEVCLAWEVPRGLMGRIPRLRWIQAVAAGVDQILGSSEVPEEVVVTSVRGIHAGPVASYVMMALAALSMGLPAMVRNQKERRWKKWAWEDLAGNTLCVVGFGAIGQEVARRARGSGMRVVAVKRTLERVGPESSLADSFYPSSALREALAQADFVVLCLPLTQETRGLFGAELLSAVKPGAFLVNVARGEILVENELINFLKNGRLRGAAIDVFAQEPLPPESPLWGVEGVLLTPHVAGVTRDYVARVARLFAENYRRFQRGEPLVNVVDRKRGY